MQGLCLHCVTRLLSSHPCNHNGAACAGEHMLSRLPAVSGLERVHDCGGVRLHTLMLRTAQLQGSTAASTTHHKASNKSQKRTSFRLPER